MGQAVCEAVTVKPEVRWKHKVTGETKTINCLLKKPPGREQSQPKRDKGGIAQRLEAGATYHSLLPAGRRWGLVTGSPWGRT